MHINGSPLFCLEIVPNEDELCNLKSDHTNWVHVYESQHHI